MVGGAHPTGLRIGSDKELDYRLQGPACAKVPKRGIQVYTRARLGYRRGREVLKGEVYRCCGDLNGRGHPGVVVLIKL